MSADHHRVRDFVVTELARRAAPLPPGLIAEKLELAADRVSVILDELEKHLTFLVRNAEGAVTWAFPVTVDETPHHATFTTGEEALFALSGRRDRDALRARAPEAGSAGGHLPNGVRPLRAAVADQGGQRAEMCRRGRS